MTTFAFNSPSSLLNCFVGRHRMTGLDGWAKTGYCFECSLTGSLNVVTFVGSVVTLLLLMWNLVFYGYACWSSESWLPLRCLPTCVGISWRPSCSSTCAINWWQKGKSNLKRLRCCSSILWLTLKEILRRFILLTSRSSHLSGIRAGIGTRILQQIVLVLFHHL